ncbi:ABC transporter substrate-binding protein [Halorubrum sp. Eb13]|uniref:ABC transporter substrate-binding protein n=1 Tax=Halorubrum sp. Eb13 TaxID=1383843 RepID=UPI000B98E367|nr:branched-chain amino acid ABC transporter substrate-binding protein [Halorubrum sp. Eb13]
MSYHKRRRDVLKTVGVAGAVGLAGCAGGDGGDGSDGGDGGDGDDGDDGMDGDDGSDGSDGGDGGDGGSGSPDLLVVIGYPESGIQLFRDYYAASDGAEDILIPDGLQDPSLPGQVGNDMNNVTGTAPAAGGPNQEAFASLYQDTYDETPGVFTSQSYDSAAALILANVAAGENNGTAIRDQLRRIANPDGTAYGPGEFIAAVEAAANGENINYQGASSAVNFDQNGDPASAAYQIWEFAGQGADSVDVQETQNFEGENPDGAGPSADSSPGGFGREVSVGILLPETGDLASTGQPMIRAAEIPAQQVNESDLDLTVNAQFEDTNTSPDQGITGAESLISSGVPAVCGTASSGVNVPVCTETLIPNEVVGCSPSSTALSVTNLEDDDYIFRTAPSDQLQGRVMAQVASERIGASTAATLYVNNDYGQQLSNRFSSVFEDTFDGEVYDQISFNIGSSSYSNVVEQALTSGN